MFTNLKITKSTGTVSDNLARLKEALQDAGPVVIGAGAGLSASAGFSYEGERFRRLFADFEAKYGFHDMYSGGFYPYQTPEEYWAYWSRYIHANRYQDPPKPVYSLLLELMENKDYFVITTNVDHCFQKAGFDKRRLFYTQGDYGLFQCPVPCHNKTYGNKDVILEMVKRQRDMRAPSELLPKCPVCGKPMIVNLRSDQHFAEDQGWHAAAQRYTDFLHARLGGKILFLELGVGFNTPGIIKYPFWQMTADSPGAVYACVNAGAAFCPEEIQTRSICLDGDIGEALLQLRDG